jgi:hypothetical protein
MTVDVVVEEIFRRLCDAGARRRSWHEGSVLK